MNFQAQLTLLTDILKNQQAQNYGTEDEFNQIHRLTESLQANGQLDDVNLQQTLSNISNYCTSRNCNEHQEQLNQWIESIGELSTPYPGE